MLTRVFSFNNARSMFNVLFVWLIGQCEVPKRPHVQGVEPTVILTNWCDKHTHTYTLTSTLIEAQRVSVTDTHTHTHTHTLPI